MSKTNSNHLFTLIKSLSKAEKRHFKLYAKRNFGTTDMKFVVLFDLLDKQKEHNPEFIKKKLSGTSDSALSGLRNHLYEQLMISLRLLHHNVPTIRIDELISFAKVLYSKGLYMQSLDQLKKAKQLALEYKYDTALYSILEQERHIELLFVTDSGYDRANELVNSTQRIKELIDIKNDWANLALLMYDYYLKFGHTKNERQYDKVLKFYQEKTSELKSENISLEGKIYKHMANTWFHFITQNFALNYRHSLLWITEMERNPDLLKRMPLIYLKGIHNVLTALYYSNKPNQFINQEKKLHVFIEENESSFDENTVLTARIYMYLAKLNSCFLTGRFSGNDEFINELLDWLKANQDYIDQNRIQVFHYKIACLYFGAGNFKEAVFYLNKIINADYKEKDLKQDVQCFARILNLVAHFELGNMDLVEYQLKSTYRFLMKYGDLQKVQEAIIDFIKSSVKMNPEGIEKDLNHLREKLETIFEDPYERRPLLYLDLIGWLTSKTKGIPVETVIKQRQQNLTDKKKLFG